MSHTETERHGRDPEFVDEESERGVLAHHSDANGKLIDLATAVVDGHRLLPRVR